MLPRHGCYESSITQLSESSLWGLLRTPRAEDHLGFYVCEVSFCSHIKSLFGCLWIPGPPTVKVKVVPLKGTCREASKRGGEDDVEVPWSPSIIYLLNPLSLPQHPPFWLSWNWLWLPGRAETPDVGGEVRDLWVTPRGEAFLLLLVEHCLFASFFEQSGTWVNPPDHSVTHLSVYSEAHHLLIHLFPPLFNLKF